MILPSIPELRLVTVLDRGKANIEAVAISVEQPCDMGQFGLLLGARLPNGRINPFFDNLFWFGDGLVHAGDWIFVYTGQGSATTSRTRDQLHNIYSVHWQRPHTMFANEAMVPVLFRVDAVSMPQPPSDVPQGNALLAPTQGLITKR